MNTYFRLMFLFFAIGCSSKYEYWDISKFNIIPSALEDNEEVDILYLSGGPNSNKTLEYYIHLIVVSQKTGDTVNVLTTKNTFGISVDGKVFRYLNQANPITKLMQTDVEKVKNVDEINRIKLKDIRKVVRNPKFDYIAINSYPTVIGIISYEELNTIKK